MGAQWGDEGKGKLTDVLAKKADLVVRYQGGNNAGHTLAPDDDAESVIKLHLIPSGVRHSTCTPVIGNGVVIDPGVLSDEIAMLAARGIDVSRLKISANAHLIMPYHKVLDRVTERHLGSSRVGTTRRGIGPCYADKASRIGLRVQDLFDEKIFRQKVEANLKEKNQILAKVYNQLPLDPEEIVEEYLSYLPMFESHICDTSLLIAEALDRGEHVLLEGAQGTLLDIDHGTYPFVTSSTPIAGGACAGAGIAPGRIDKVIGVTKAYVTRVGAGPFPTEELGTVGQRLVELGDEFGTTTGRTRRCGWFDAVLLRLAHRLNGFSELFLTKLDVLSAFEKVKICCAYDINGDTVTEFPYHQSDFHHAIPKYEVLEGWEEDISSARKFSELPSQAQAYIRYIEEAVGVAVSLISVGPTARQTIEVGT